MIKKEFHKQLFDARQKAAAWCNLAMEMISELRQDYPPGEKTELDGVEMIKTLRRKIKELEEENELVKAHDGAITDIRGILGNDVEECDCLKDGHD